MSEQATPAPPEEITYCVYHPKVETGLRCNKCDDPICARCAVRTPVGYRCKRCIREQQSIFYTGLPIDYVIAAVISLPAAAVGAYLISFIGFFFAFFVSPVAGVLIADLVWRVVGRRRSRYLWIVVCGSIIVATLGVALYQAGAIVTGADLLRLELGIYLVMAVSAAYSRLRLG